MEPEKECKELEKKYLKIKMKSKKPNINFL